MLIQPLNRCRSELVSSFIFFLLIGLLLGSVLSHSRSQRDDLFQEDLNDTYKRGGEGSGNNDDDSNYNIKFGFSLVNAESHDDIQEIIDGSVIDLKFYKNVPLTLRMDYNTTAPVQVTQIKFDLDDGTLGVLSMQAPYLLGGWDHQNKYDSNSTICYYEVLTLKQIGLHTISATALTNFEELEDLNATFYVINSLENYIPTLPPVPNYDVKGYSEGRNDNIGADVVIYGQHKKWTTITLRMLGYVTAEYDPIGPVANFRFDVKFQHSGTNKSYNVPGYYACDGNSANTGQWSGETWLTHFVPDEVGTWMWTASFRSWNNVSDTDSNRVTTESAGSFDGASGLFEIHEHDVNNTTSEGGSLRNKTDFRYKGRLQSVGRRHYQFSETGEYFLKFGVRFDQGSVLSDIDFDEDYRNDENNINNTTHFVFTKHVQDYVEGDITWRNGTGKGIIGAINFLASKGVNTLSFLTMDDSDGKYNVYPFVPRDDQFLMDCSKLAQWNVVFEHANKKGIMIQIRTQTSRAGLDPETKLYFRELIARFSHHLHLEWCVLDNGFSNLIANYIRSIDPYKHPIVIQKLLETKDEVSDLYASKIDGASLYHDQQTRLSMDEKYYATLHLVKALEETGNMLAITNDITTSDVCERDDNTSEKSTRYDVIWSNIMAGGAGLEIVLNASTTPADCSRNIEFDYRLNSNLMDKVGQATDFFQANRLPFWLMYNSNERVVSGDGWCLVQENGDSLVIYHKNSPLALNLTHLGVPGYSIEWYNPRTGYSKHDGSISTVEIGEAQFLGNPLDADKDPNWVVVLRGLDYFPTPPLGKTATERNSKNEMQGKQTLLNSKLLDSKTKLDKDPN